jgi:hypothetical protein
MEFLLLRSPCAAPWAAGEWIHCCVVPAVSFEAGARGASSYTIKVKYKDANLKPK